MYKESKLKGKEEKYIFFDKIHDVQDIRQNEKVVKWTGFSDLTNKNSSNYRSIVSG